MRRSSLAASAPLLALVAGCDGCGKDRPYTPFGVASGSASAAVTTDTGAPEPSGPDAERGRFVTRLATPAPERAARWSFEGRPLEAPAGRVFERALAADFDGDGAREVVAWTLPAAPDGTLAPGELWLFPASAAPRKLLGLPGFVPTGPGCRHDATLAQTGPRSVTLDVSASCATPLLGRAPVRSLSVVAPLGRRPEVLTLRVAAASAAEPFALDVDSTDRDGDGRDDVRLVVTQKPPCKVDPAAVGSSCPTDKDDRAASAQVVWLDRAAGLSRDTTEPAASLARLAAAELGRSKRPSTSALVPRGVAQVRRLMGTLCAEGAAARLFDADGNMLRCAPLGVVVDRLLAAEVQAALTDRDPGRALAALDRDGWYFGRASDKLRADLVKKVGAELGSVEAKESSLSLAVPPRGDAPRWSPLAFESSGALLVLTADGVRRVTPSGESEAVDPDSGVASWPLAVTSSSGRRLATVALACERSDAYPVLEDGPGRAPGAPPSALLAPRPGACAGGRPPAVAVVPLGDKDGQLSLWVAGEILGPRLSRAEAALRPRVLGAPRSPDGRHVVFPTSLGLLVEGPERPALWRVSAPGTLSDCVVADAAAAVACVAGTQVKVFRP